MQTFTLLLLSAWITASLAAQTPLPVAKTVGPATSTGEALPHTPTVWNLRGEYFNGTNFGQWVFSRADSQLNFHWRPGESPGPRINQSAFSARWTATLYTPVEGTYNFIVHTDNGVRVWVGGKLLIDNWRVHNLTTFKKEIKLKAGSQYDLKIEYNNYLGPAILRVAWETPIEGTATSGLPHYTPAAVLSTRQIATTTPTKLTGTTLTQPIASPAPAPADGNGLLGEYYRGENFEEKVFSRIDKQIDIRRDGSPGPGIGAEFYSIRWTGKLLAPEDGTYKFHMKVDDGMRLWIGGKLVLDEWRWEPEIQYSTQLDLQGGRYYDIQLEYFNGPQTSIAELSWESPENRFSLFGLEVYSSSEIIPSKYLFPSSPPKKPNPGIVPVRARTDNPQTPRLTALPPAPEPKRLPESKSPEKRLEKPPVVPAGNKQEEVKKETTVFEHVEAGKPVVLRQVHFEQSQYVLLPHSYTELDQLADLLLEHPGWQVEIAGHTDNVGDPRLNLALSENRALVVANYLVRQGVAEGRIKARGYGSTRPLADNQIETERARNRRVEFMLARP